MRMRSLPVALLALAASTAGCGKPPEPVDPVPSVEDVNNIVVNGKAMTKTEFIDEYCLTFELQMNHPTCIQVLDAHRMDFRRPPGSSRRF